MKRASSSKSDVVCKRRKCKADYIDEDKYINVETITKNETFQYLDALGLSITPNTIFSSLINSLTSTNRIIQEYCERCFLWVMNKDVNLKDPSWGELVPLLNQNKLFFISAFRFVHKKSFPELLKNNYLSRRTASNHCVFTTDLLDIYPEVLNRAELNKQAQRLLETAKLEKPHKIRTKIPSFNNIVIDAIIKK